MTYFMRRLKHLLFSLAIFFGISIIFPESTFFALLAALIVNILSSDYSGSQTLVDFASPQRLMYKRKLQNHFKSSNNISDLIQSISVSTEQLLAGKNLNYQFIHSLNPTESCGLILGLQSNNDSLKFDSSLNNYHFKELAGKAAKSINYRKLLIREALSGVGKFDKKYVEELSQNINFVIGDDLKKISDLEFNKKIKESLNDKLTVFSTTSQLSSDLIDILEEYPKTIRQVDFYICSPFVKSDTAILLLEQEYKNPSFSIPIGQFITSDGDKVNVKMDSLRRVLKILSSINRLSELSKRTCKEINVFLFRKRYPGIKIKLLSEKKFLQIQPGPLAYANNMYRFGVSTNNSEICSELEYALKEFRDDKSVLRGIKLNDLNFERFSKEVIQETSLWLLENGVTSQDLERYRKDINLSVKDVAVNSWIELISGLIQQARETIQYTNFSLVASKEKLHIKLQSQNNSESGIFCEHLSNLEIKHVTVAMLLVKDDKILLVRKSDPVYQGKFSIVAGHVNNKESPFEAIIREVKEEIGLVLKSPQFVTRLDNVRDRCRYNGVLHDWIIFHTTEMVDYRELQIDKSEISDFELIHLSELRHYSKNMTFGCRNLFESLGYI